MNIMQSLSKLFNPGVSVGKVTLPLHGKIAANPGARMAHHLAMQEMAGVNHLGHPKGFRQAPTSRKNPAFHAKHPTTRLERLAKAAEKGVPA